MSIYGEGRYARPDGGAPTAVIRAAVEQLRAHEWELRDADGTALIPVPTDEDKVLDPTSIYALTKADQERWCCRWAARTASRASRCASSTSSGRARRSPTPTPGVAAIFSARLLNGNPPLIFEDGEQSRDFVSVHDIVQALLLSVQEDAGRGVGNALNVGSGAGVSVNEVARRSPGSWGGGSRR
jgi:dTDP-L-rhamnose 4-epimerase